MVEFLNIEIGEQSEEEKSTKEDNENATEQDYEKILGNGISEAPESNVCMNSKHLFFFITFSLLLL